MHDELMIWFARAVGHSLWGGALIGVLAWAARFGSRKRPARDHAILCGAMVLMALCLPALLWVLAPDWTTADGGSHPGAGVVAGPGGLAAGAGSEDLPASMAVSGRLAEGAEAGQPGPAVFFLLPSGKVRWDGVDYDQESLKAVLPGKGEGAIIQAAAEAPHRDLVKLLEALVPIYGREGLGLKVIAGEGIPGGGDGTGERRADPLEAERAKRRTEAAEAGARLLEAERKLRLLEASGLGGKHPRLQQAEREREELRKKLGTENDPAVREARRRVAIAELQDLEAEIAELRADGHGAKHPKVLVARKRAETLRELLDRLEVEANRDGRPSDQRPEVEPDRR